MTLRGLIDAVEVLVADAEADKADAIAEAQGTGERPDLWEWNVFIGLDDAKNMLAILRALDADQREGGRDG